MNARYEAAAAIQSIDTTKMFPALACQREPLLNEIAAAPATMANTPAVT
jgi:hypothetical protein